MAKLNPKRIKSTVRLANTILAIVLEEILVLILSHGIIGLPVAEVEYSGT